MGIAVGLFALAIGSQQVAYAGTSVTNASFLITTTIVMTPFIAWFMLRERPAAVLWPAASLTLIGTFLLGGAGFSSLNWGDLCCLVSAALYSAWIVVLGRLVTRTGCPGFVMLAHFILGGALCLAIGVASEPAGFAEIENAIPELLILGVFSTGLAYVFQALAQQRTSAGVAALIMSAESVFGALGGAWLLEEQMSLTAGIGAGLIMAAILMVQVGPKPSISRAIGHLVAGFNHSRQAWQRAAVAGHLPRAFHTGRAHRI